MFSKNPPRAFLRLLALTLATSLTVPLSAAEVTVSAVDQKGNPTEDLIIWLDPLDGPMPAAIASGSAVAEVEQVDEEFNPYTIVVRTGTKVVFPNRDDVQHHVYSLSRPAQFEIPLHGHEVTESVVLDQAGVVPIGCNIHDWMLSYIVVVDSPWFGGSDPAGRVSIAEVPAGRYRLTAWHPRMRKNVEQEITVNATSGTRVDLELRLRPDRRIRRAPGAGGSGY